MPGSALSSGSTQFKKIIMNLDVESLLGFCHDIKNLLRNMREQLRDVREKLSIGDKRNSRVCNQLKRIEEELVDICDLFSEILRLRIDEKNRTITKNSDSADLRILWVEDDELQMSALRGVFDDAKWHLTTTSEADEGWSLVTTDEFDGVMLDVMMPWRSVPAVDTAAGLLSGLFLARRIREIRPGMPIVFLTVARSRELTDWCNANPPAIVIFKPALSWDIVGQVETLIRFGSRAELDGLESLLERFPTYVRALRPRHAQRRGFRVADEYDVQDLLRGLLAIKFDDVREEEWSPSYAGASSRIDFLLPQLATAIEVKMATSRTSIRQLSDQLLIDIARYKKHPDVNSLICFIVDAKEVIVNRDGLIRDFRQSSSQELEVRAVICSLNQ